MMDTIGLSRPNPYRDEEFISEFYTLHNQGIRLKAKEPVDYITRKVKKVEKVEFDEPPRIVHVPLKLTTGEKPLVTASTSLNIKKRLFNSRR